MPLRFRQKLQVLGQQNSDKRCPNLNPNRIFAGADERFDLETQNIFSRVSEAVKPQTE